MTSMSRNDGTAVTTPCYPVHLGTVWVLAKRLKADESRSQSNIRRFTTRRALLFGSTVTFRTLQFECPTCKAWKFTMYLKVWLAARLPACRYLRCVQFGRLHLDCHCSPASCFLKRNDACCKYLESIQVFLSERLDEYLMRLKTRSMRTACECRDPTGSNTLVLSR